MDKPPCEFFDREAVPKNWTLQQHDLTVSGLGHNVKHKIPLVIVNSWRKNLGKGCENTLLIQFKGQTNNHHFIGSHFKTLKKDD